MRIDQRSPIGLILLLIGFLCAPTPVAAQSLSARVAGTLIFAQYDLDGEGSAWLGCSVILNDESEYDLPAVRVSGHGSHVYAIPAHIARSCGEFACALWSHKVRDRRNKMGYHLEGRFAVCRDVYPAADYITWRERDGLVHLFVNDAHAGSYQRTHHESAGDSTELARRALAAAERFLDLAIGLAGALPGTSAVPPVHKWIGRDPATSRDHYLAFRLHWQDQVIVGLEAYGPVTAQIARDLRGMGFGGKSGQFVYSFY